MFEEKSTEKRKYRVYKTVCECPHCLNENKDIFKTQYSKKPYRTMNKITFDDHDDREHICIEDGTCWWTRESEVKVYKTSQLVLNLAA